MPFSFMENWITPPVIGTVEYQEDSQAEKKYETNSEEEPEEILAVMTDIASIVFLVPE